MGDLRYFLFFFPPQRQVNLFFSPLGIFVFHGFDSRLDNFYDRENSDEK